MDIDGRLIHGELETQPAATFIVAAFLYPPAERSGQSGFQALLIMKHDDKQKHERRWY
jgi:hypothetical protein